MTYTFKLSRRLAQLRDAAMIAASLFTLSCTASDDPSGPGTSPSGITISPNSTTVRPNQSVQFEAVTQGVSSLVWTATGGTVDSSGRYTAGEGEGTYQTVVTRWTRLGESSWLSLADTAVVTIAAIAQIVLSPASVSLPAGASLQFAAQGKTADDATISVVPRYTATGGTISAGGVYTAGQTAGDFRVIATDSATGKADTSAVTITPPSPTPPSPPPPSPVLEAVVLTPTSVSLAPGATQQFAAVGRMSDGSTGALTVSWSVSAGTISSAGLYTAGLTAGTFRVIATQAAGTLADTADVTVAASTPPPPGPALEAVVLTPTSVSLAQGTSQQFAAVGRMSDGSTSAVSVSWTASAGTISSAGLYTAGQTAGTLQVIATQSGGTLADTAVVTVTAPPPPPPPTNGTTFFNATAETGTEAPWSLPSPGWGARFNGDHSATQTRVNNGLWAYKYEVTNSGTGAVAHDVRTMSGQPQTSMGSPHGRYLGGYFSWWMYLDAGYTTPAETTAWNLLMGWMTGVDGAPNPICNIGLEVRSGVLQLIFVLKNMSDAGGTPLGPPPTLPGMTHLGSAWYKPTNTVAFPRNQWVHVTVYNNFAQSSGVFKVWQDGVLIMDLTAPTMNLFTGWTNSGVNGANTAGDMMLQFGNYGGHQDGTQRFYMDDFKVTDFRPLP